MDTQATILLVEDDKFLSTILKTRLEREGFKVVVAMDGEEGLAALKQEAPALIVLDIVMPKMSGFEFLERKAMDPQVGAVPVVIASQLGQESDIEKARALGATNYFIKAQTPIEELVKKLKEAMGGNV